MLSLEMIGYFTDNPNSQDFPSEELKAIYPSVGNFISVVGNERVLTECIATAMREQVGLSVHHLISPADLTGIAFSDHLSYWRAGYPAVMITDTAFFRNKNYHTAGDLASTLDYQRMSKVIESVLRVIRKLDTGCTLISK